MATAPLLPTKQRAIGGIQIKVSHSQYTLIAIKSRRICSAYTVVSYLLLLGLSHSIKDSN